jgi:medium-chain acyl-[acyl-carrier-protein] hydrolase
MADRRTHALAATTGAACLVPCRAEQSAARLGVYCLPHAGGSASLFWSWRSLLPPDIALWGLEYPGHGRRIAESPVDRIDRLAAEFATALAGEPRRPYALFGHSMGCLVAFEACHMLMAWGAPLPTLLIVAAHGAPRLPPTEPPVHAAPDREFIAKLRDLDATPSEVLESSELLEFMLPILRADFRACETYVPADRPKLPVRIAAYGGLADADVGPDQLLAWDDETTGDCALRMFPGGHFFPRTAPERVTAMLARDVADARGIAALHRRAS